MVPYKRPASDKSGQPVYQPVTTTPDPQSSGATPPDNSTATFAQQQQQQQQQHSATAYQQALLHLQQPFVPVTCKDAFFTALLS
jgi:hypothetical protein